MSNESWRELDFWKNYSGSLESPFNREKLTDQSMFLWNEMTAPLPYGHTAGAWGAFPEPEALIGFLKYIVLPTFFETWLIREEWDEEPEKYISPEELFNRARNSEKCRYTEDIIEMKGFIDSLNSLFGKSYSEIKSGLQEIEKKFNAKWSDTPTWCFRIEGYDSPGAVCSEILGRHEVEMTDEDDFFQEEMGFSKEEWKHICKNAASDLEAQDKFFQILERNASF